eukprot:24868-Hanusia_phi.AAC.2
MYFATQSCLSSVMRSFMRGHGAHSTLKVQARTVKITCSTHGSSIASTNSSICSLPRTSSGRANYGNFARQSLFAVNFTSHRQLSTGPEGQRQDKQELSYIYRNTLSIMKEAVLSSVKSVTSVKSTSPKVASGSVPVAWCASERSIGPEMRTISLALSTLLLTTPITLFFPSAVGQLIDISTKANSSVRYAVSLVLLMKLAGQSAAGCRSAVQDTLALSIAKAEEVFSNIRLVRQYVREDFETCKYRELVDLSRDQSISVGIANSLMGSSIHIASNISLAAVLG